MCHHYITLHLLDIFLSDSEVELNRSRLNQELLCELRLAFVGKDPRNSWRILQPRPHGPAVRWTETVTQVRIVGSVDWESFSTGSVNLHKIWESEGCPDDRLIDQAGPSASMLVRDQAW